ncbi:MAG: thiamine biosynthesis lipoprotein [Saprospiraceae bacterium]|jgi:thiamine biosynthesis lipoprotein
MMNRYALLIFVFASISCGRSSEYHKFSGETMGTYYLITFQGESPQKVKSDVERLLVDFNNSLSTYIPSSFISQLNDSEGGILLPMNDPFFEPVLNKATELQTLTNGKLNTAILPLLTYWRDNSSKIDSAKSKELQQLVANSKFEIIESENGKFVSKSHVKAKLDFSSLAKGYGIDVIGSYFEKLGVTNYLVDIGGEARGAGMSQSGQKWRLAINKPVEGSSLTEMELVVQLSGESIATSGSYRQFYEKGGRKIAHIMDPITGYSTTSDLLSASVIAEDCMTADALATALMVSSLEEAKTFLVKNNIKACLIYDSDGDSKLEKYFANGFEELVLHSQ